MEQELMEYMETALKITKEAGKIMLHGFQNAKRVEVKNESWDIVTEYDRQIETLLKEELTKAYPTHKFIGEETAAGKEGEQELTDDPTWIIDPIDGTINYVHSFPISCICVGLAVNKVMVVGIVYNPMLDNMFTAIKGHGAFLNDKPIHTSNVTDLSTALVSFEISFAADIRYRDIVMKRGLALVSNARGLRSIGSAAMAMCFVANGSFDAYHIDGLHCWDVAASSLIIQEAGGFLINTDGSTFDVMSRQLVCAGTNELLKQMLDCIKRA